MSARPAGTYRATSVLAGLLVLGGAGFGVRAQSHDHTTPQQPPASKETQTDSPSTPSSEPDIDHAAMGHGQTTTHRPSQGPDLPPLTAADRAAAFPDVAGHAAHDDMIHYRVLFDQLEWQNADEGEVLAWDVTAWAGRDIDRVWLRSEGERVDELSEVLNVEALWGHAFARWWDFVAGARQDVDPGSSRTWAAFGVQGVAPYKFEVQATAYVGESGRTAAKLEAEYELLLTNRWILEPLIELAVHGEDDPQRGIGSGLSTTEVGLRLRYEIQREFAPYIGVTWDRKWGNTADLARQEGAAVEDTRWIAGLRIWF